MRARSLINTTEFAASMREKIIRPSSGEVLIACIAGSEQEPDLTLPPNCGGVGRIRHFHRRSSSGWGDNPLPIDPAVKALGLKNANTLTAQVFQNAACAWRCWYCYVPFNLLSGDPSRSKWINAAALVELYAEQDSPPRIIDLSGGSPDLTPEWVVWMMEALEDAGLSQTTYLWSDDNLSTDYVFTKLNNNQRQKLVDYKNYGRVCCIKGFDHSSFAFNTTADYSAYDNQFAVLRRYVELGIDVYGYVTLTGPSLNSIDAGIPDLVARLRSIHAMLPLRFVPLKIEAFTPTLERTQDGNHFKIAEAVQSAAFERWKLELHRVYTAEQLALNITDIRLWKRS